MTVQELDFSVDILRAQLWQYDGKHALTTLMRGESDWYQESYSDFWRAWYRDVFDLRTATEFGCSVWSYILDAPLQIATPTKPENVKSWGFGEANENFEHGNFGATGQESEAVPISVKRLLLIGRYIAFTSNFSIPSINFALHLAFKDYGKAYVLDGEDMSFTVVFDFPLAAFLRRYLERLDLIPHPAGVGVKFVVNPRKKPWGFGEANENFEHGNFAPQNES